MAELDFEMKLDRMFHEAPVLSDAETFAKLVELRLDRGWSLRQLVIGGAGLAAGLIGVFQLLGSGLLVGAGAATERQLDVLTRGASGLFRASEGVSRLPIGGEVLWMAVALGVMALAFAVTRAVEEFQ